ncbi:serine/threonine-protein kinase SMG1 isoform X2 [Cimex lectularius]|uniref:non-specific serine/threonine protein kinase n=1 Tax=Cimex lectularius TaxID=79782 RepID=A0A8I6RL32_CIMLE|nr:serine/threonine-protein kinase SMG1 isoform X2 [Cimex lectularius]
MLSGSGESSKSPKGKEEKKSSKEEAKGRHIPSIVVTRGRSEARSKARKKDDFIGRTRSFGDERRGGFRGRGKRPDDYSARRFQENKKTHETSQYKTDYVPLVYLPEDSRISTCLRRLAREEDEKKFTSLCKMLQDSLSLPENAAYIHRSLVMILESLFELMCTGMTQQCRKWSAQTLGHVGYVLEKDFNRFMDWIFSKFNSEKKDCNRVLIMTAVLELSKLDKKVPKLNEYAQQLMAGIREIMEITDVGDIFMVTTEITLTLTHRYPETFTQYFHDMIDIIVGWHIDPMQTPAVTKCATRSLKRLAPYWLQDMSFTVTLLQQFLEDTDTCFEEMASPQELSEDEIQISNTDQLSKITSFILVFKSVFKGLDKNMDPAVCPSVTWEFLEKSLTKVITIVLRSLTVTVHSNLIIAGNKCIILILNFLNSDSDEVYSVLLNYIYTLFSLNAMSKKALASLFRLVAKILDSMPSKTTPEFVDTLLKPDSIVLKKRLSVIELDVLKVYESLLHHSQLPILLCAYGHVVADLDAALRTIKPNMETLVIGENNLHKNTSYDKEIVEEIVIFLLRAIAELAQANNPVTSLFTLKPTIFDILAIHLPSAFRPASYPKLHIAYMKLLKSHCTRNNYFVSSAKILAQTSKRQHLVDALGIETPQSSAPSGTQMVTIINLLIENLVDILEEKNKIFIMQWVNELLTVTNRQYKSLLSSVEMLELVKGLCYACADFRPNLTLQGVAVLQSIVTKFKGLWPPEIMSKLLDLCIYFMNSSCPEIRKRFHLLMMALPSLIVTFSINNCASYKFSMMNKLMLRNYQEMARSMTGEMTATRFKQLMNYMLFEESVDPEFKWMTEILASGWPVMELGYQHGLEAMNSLGLTTEWLAFQAACLCRDSKLRTALGKPLGTFTAIEVAIRDLALETKLNKNMLKTPATGRRVRMLVQFVEQLEKALYNAAEGTASAFPLITKQAVKSFFCLNRGSCYEWFTRIRFAILVVSLHCGLSAASVRHGFALLQSHLDNNSTNTPEFQNILLNVGWALANMGEKEAIQGLYEWAKNTANVKEPILEPLIHMAARRYESATEGFESLAKEIMSNSTETDNNESSDIAQQIKNKTEMRKIFIADQLTESYLALNNWQDLLNWKKTESDFLSNENGCSTRRYKHVSLNFVETIAKFDEGEYEAAKEMFTWNGDDRESLLTMDRCRWDYNNLLEEVDYILKCSLIKNHKHLNSRAKYDEAQSLAESIIEECVKDSPSELLGRAALLKFTSYSLLNSTNYVVSQFYGGDYWWKKCIKSPEMERAVWWGNALNKMKKGEPSRESKNFILQCVKVARKTGNLKYATRVLLLHLKSTDKTLKDVAENYISATPKDFTSHEAMIQVSKLMKKCGQSRQAMRLSATVALRLQESSMPELIMLSSKVLRNIAAEFKTGKSSELKCPELDKVFEYEQTNGFGSHFEDLNCFRKVSEDCSGSNDEELLTGRLLRLSLSIWPMSSKSWERLAAWAYAGGVKESAKGIASTPEERAALESELPQGVTVQAVSNMLAAYHSHEVDVDTVSSEMIEQQLRELGTFSNEQIKSLLDIWKKTHSRVYTYFRLSAYSYFRYIQISEYHEEDNVIVTATLRLLRLIVRHATELQRVVENGLSTTPTAPWIAIVPQLFSRLNHPEPYVRKRVSELLIRIGNDSPHLITFPAIVGSGSNTMPTTKLLTIMKYDDKSKVKGHEEGEEENDEEEEVDDDDDDGNDDEMKVPNEKAAVLENSFGLILEALSRKYGEEINQVKTLIAELRRITLLWDELWLGTLNQHQPDISRRFTQLGNEVKCTETNFNLSQETKQFIIAEKYRLILKPLLFVLEQLRAITFVTPETPHEKNFQEKYAKDIENVLTKLKQPDDPRDPNGALQALGVLQSSLQASSCSGRRGGGQLSMKDISPALGKLKLSKIAMPGVVRDPATIKSIADTVIVLPSNTKPKKLVFNGSNGLKYTYLFKGLEDLHLDERIMQFLSIANYMLKETSLRAHHYSVVPLGPRSGLISWVENVTPIFTLYKKWQEREAANDSTETNSVMRPSALFYSKLGPILKDAGITSINQVQRNKWPLWALKKCLTELMHCTPTYLLSKELWCFSINAAHWWNITKLYSSSLAVMSMIGYIIGLGDRHLDNVLVNLKTGEVVHIDYNICFEKGKTLRVPEKVPFRLTQNLRAALGVTGIEGIYRQTCERVLEVLKSGQETLLTLLEAFVYDPLIDWTPLNEDGYTGAVYGGGRELVSETKQSKKDLEHEVNSCMFKVRITEAKHQWLENKRVLEYELNDLVDMIEIWQRDDLRIRKSQESLKERHTQMALLKEAEGQPQHALYSLGARYAKHVQVYSAKQATLQALKSRIQESEMFLNQFQTVIATLRGAEMAQWVAEVKRRPQSDVCQVFDLIKEFLHNAGRSQMVQQCNQSEKEVGELCVQQTQLTATLLDMLGKYWEISQQYPASYLKRHRMMLYKLWAEQLCKDMSPKTCDRILVEMKQEFAVSEDAIRQAGMYSAGLHRHTAEATSWLTKAMRRVEGNSLSSQQGERSGSVSLDRIIKSGQPSDTSAITGVVLTALCALNKKFLMVESQATSAGDCLLNLMSRDGDWFLDDMCTVAGTAVKLSQLLPALSNPDEIPADINVAYKCIQCAFSQYNALQGLHNNFTGIILVEAMQALQSEEPSVVAMVDKLEQIVSSILIPLSDLLNQLQRHLRFVILGMESQHTSFMVPVESLRMQFEELLSHGEDNLTQGQMLLMGFNGLFTNLEDGRDVLLGHLKSLTSPPAWKIVDQIREAMQQYTAPICQETPMAIIESMFFVKRVQTMLEVLRMSRADAAGFRGAPSPQVPHDRETLTRPVRKYIAEYISYQMLGVFSLSLATLICLLLEKEGFDVTGEVEQKDIGTQSRVPLDELCKKMIDQLGKPQQVRHASGVVSQAEAIWRQEDTRARLERELNNARALAHRLQLMLTGHHWLHEHCLVNSPTPPINRGNFMLEMRKAMTTLLALQRKMEEVVLEQNNLITSSEQRLKWATGANPALSEVMSAFESSVTANKERLEAEKNLAMTVVNMCSTILTYEALRTPTSEALSYDSAFAVLVMECKSTHLLITSNAVALSSAEEGLVLLLPPKRKIDSEWICKAEELISESVRNLNSEIEPLQMNLLSSEDCVKNKATMIRSTMSKHHRIVSDIRTLLKAMVKYEDAGLSGLNSYLMRYKKFTDTISSMTKSVGMATNLNANLINKAIEDAKTLQQQIDSIYMELLAFSVSDTLTKRPPLVRQSTICESPRKEKEKKPKRRGMQERNAYAMNVWRRVKFKLEGRDPDPGVRSSVKQQVDWTISEATNLDNLSLLYEGWTPWV